MNHAITDPTSPAATIGTTSSKPGMDANPSSAAVVTVESASGAPAALINEGTAVRRVASGKCRGVIARAGLLAQRPSGAENPDAARAMSATIPNTQIRMIPARDRFGCEQASLTST